MFNLGHTDEIAIDALAELVKAMTDSPSEIVCLPYAPADEAGFEDMARRRPDLSAIQRAIGSRPTLDLPRLLAWIIADDRMELDQPAPMQRVSDNKALARGQK